MLQDILYKYLIPLLIYGFITGLANLLLSKKSQVELWAESHPKAAAVQKLLRAIGLDPWQIVSAVSLWATKKLPDAQRSEGLKAADPKPSRDDDKTPPWGPAPVAVLLFAGLAFHSQACATTESHACNPADVAAITAEYIADMSAQCQGFTFDSCPARPVLEAKLKAQHEEKCPTH